MHFAYGESINSYGENRFSGGAKSRKFFAHRLVAEIIYIHRQDKNGEFQL